MERVQKPAEEGGQEAGSLYHCDACGVWFCLPSAQPVDIRFVGHIPKVECSSCKRRHEDAGLLSFPLGNIPVPSGPGDQL